MAGPNFVNYMCPVIWALKELGNSGTPLEVCDWIAQELRLPNDVVNERMKSGTSRFQNQVAWARFYLAKSGYIGSSKRGVWSLTEKGINSDLSEEDAWNLYRETQHRLKNETSSIATNVSEDYEAPKDDQNPYIDDYRGQLLELIRNLSSSGFERLCQRFLRESGFQQVQITGKTGDGGVDGIGILQINPLLSMKVVFQCKRYNANNAVTSSHVRNLRGAMEGRTDKGIFITTSTFTSDAYKEASREGATPIELVDGEKLVSMLEQLELGLKPRTIYTIDSDFFAEFM